MITRLKKITDYSPLAWYNNYKVPTPISYQLSVISYQLSVISYEM